jgi:hypothetical protein
MRSRNCSFFDGFGLYLASGQAWLARIQANYRELAAPKNFGARLREPQAPELVEGLSSMTTRQNFKED